MLIRKLEIQTLVDGDTYNPTDEDWLVYGHSDILKTKIINMEDSVPKGINAIYEDGLKFDSTFHQVFYLIMDESDEEFWEEAKKSYFCSIFFVTLSLDIVLESYDIFAKLDQSSIPHNVRMYNLLDNYDTIIVTYGNDINEIEKCVEELFKEIKKTDELKIRDLYKMYITSFQRLNNNYINNASSNNLAHIQIVLQNGNEIQCSQLNKILNNKYNIRSEVYYTNGSKNIFILLHNLSTQKLFALYNTEEKGIFAVNSKLRKNSIRSTNLKFLLSNENLNLSYIQQFNNTDIAIKFSKQIDQYLSNENLQYIDEFYFMQIKRVAFSLKYILLHNLPDHSFLSLYYPIRKFLVKITQLKHISTDIELCTRLFIQACIEIINVSDSTQIGHYPVQTYISKELSTPSKLITFYTAFLWKFNKEIVAIENSDESDKPNFVFCLTPSIKNDVSIVGLFLFDNLVNDRLLLVNIPLKYFYDPEIMIFAMAHEGSHYVGEKVRCRDKRKEYIIISFVSYLLNVLFKSIDEKLIETYKLDKKLNSKFADYIKKYSRDYEYNCYSKNLKEIIIKSSFSLLVDILFKIRSVIMVDIHYNNDDIQNIVKELFTIVSKLKINSKTLLLENEYYKQIEYVFEIFSESYADLFAILILNVDGEFYLNCLTKSYGVNDISEINDSFVLMRLISNVVVNNFDQSLLKGKASDLLQIYKEYKKSDYGASTKTFSELYASPLLLEYLIQYLNVCKSLYLNIYQKSMFEDLKNGIFNANVNWDLIRKYNDEFRKDIISNFV